jgi:hypothetical protein
MMARYTATQLSASHRHLRLVSQEAHVVAENIYNSTLVSGAHKADRICRECALYCTNFIMFILTFFFRYRP